MKEENEKKKMEQSKIRIEQSKKKKEEKKKQSEEKSNGRKIIERNKKKEGRGEIKIRKER